MLLATTSGGNKPYHVIAFCVEKRVSSSSASIYYQITSRPQEWAGNVFVALVVTDRVFFAPFGHHLHPHGIVP